MENDIRMSDISFSEEFLEHHGILGQKWGKKNGPPYPLDSDVSTGKRLKNVSKKKSIGKSFDEYKKNRLKKKKEAWSKDPEKILKNADKFSTEEIQKAANDIKNRKEAIESLKNTQPKKLSFLKSQLSKDPDTLYKYRKLFSKEEMDLATERLDRDLAARALKNEKFRQDQEKATSALNTVNKGAEVVKNLAGAASGVASAKSMVTASKIKDVELRSARDKAAVSQLQSMLDARDLNYKLKNFDANKSDDLWQKRINAQLDIDERRARIRKTNADAAKAEASVRPKSSSASAALTSNPIVQSVSNTSMSTVRKKYTVKGGRAKLDAGRARYETAWDDWIQTATAEDKEDYLDYLRTAKRGRV